MVKSKHYARVYPGMPFSFTFIFNLCKVSPEALPKIECLTCGRLIIMSNMNSHIEQEHAAKASKKVCVGQTLLVLGN